jgi:hypothetical protein
MTRPGERAWTENTTTFDRVRSVVLALSKPQSAEYIADEAVVDAVDAFGTVTCERSSPLTGKWVVSSFITTGGSDGSPFAAPC